MKRVILALAAVALFAQPVFAADWYVQPNSTTAGPITFSEALPKDAFRQAHHSQFHSNPYTDVSCYDAAGTLIYRDVTYVQTKTSIAGGFLAVTYPLTLPVSPRCQAVAVYFVDTADGVTAVTPASVEFATN